MPKRLAPFWFVVSSAFRADPVRAALSWVLVPAVGLTTAAMALWLKLLADGVVSRRAGLALTGAVALALTATLEHIVRVVLAKVRFRLQESTSLVLEREVVAVAAGAPGLDIHERPELRDRLEHVRAERGNLGQAVGATVMTAQVVVEGLATLVVLAVVHPLLLLLPLLALPSLATGARAATLLDDARRGTGEQRRLASHYLDLSSSVGVAKEWRLFGLRDEVRRRHRRLLSDIGRARVDARLGAAAWEAAGSLLFVAGYVAAAAFVLRRVQLGQASVGDLFLTLQLASHVNGNVTSIARVGGWLRRVLLAAEDFLWLDDQTLVPRLSAQRRTVPPPPGLRQGIALERVSFRYPGTDRDVLRDVNLLLPAGKVVALVGENGAGKTTLVKLLCGFYTPTAGRILVEGVDLEFLDLDGWRSHLSGAFQDYAKFEFTVQESVGVGDLSALDDQQRVLRAIDEVGATSLVRGLPRGLDTPLGPAFSGVELSEGQWQALALARSRMRTTPLLHVLDEPAAALDAAGEQALYSQVTRLARNAGGRGGITLLVSHRLSTVKDADLIVVLKEGRVVEVGSHDELMAAPALYAELFSLQARAYQ